MKAPLSIHQDIGGWVLFVTELHTITNMPNEIKRGIARFWKREDAEYVMNLIEEDARHIKLFVKGGK